VDERRRSRCAAAGFAKLADAAQAAFRQLLAHGAWWPWVVNPTGLCLIGWLSDRTLAERHAS